MSKVLIRELDIEALLREYVHLDKNTLSSYNHANSSDYECKTEKEYNQR